MSYSADRIAKTKAASTANSQDISPGNVPTINSTEIITIKETFHLTEKMTEGTTHLGPLTDASTTPETMTDTTSGIKKVHPIDMTDINNREAENTNIAGIQDLHLQDAPMIVTDGMTLIRTLRVTGSTRETAEEGIVTMRIGETSINTVGITGEVALTGLVLRAGDYR